MQYGYYIPSSLLMEVLHTMKNITKIFQAMDTILLNSLCATGFVYLDSGTLNTFRKYTYTDAPPHKGIQTYFNIFVPDNKMAVLCEKWLITDAVHPYLLPPCATVISLAILIRSCVFISWIWTSCDGSLVCFLSSSSFPLSIWFPVPRLFCSSFWRYSQDMAHISHSCF